MTKHVNKQGWIAPSTEPRTWFDRALIDVWCKVTAATISTAGKLSLGSSFGLYAASTWRGKVWDWLHQELPQSGPLIERSHLVTPRFEQRELELEQQFEDKQSVPPPVSAG